MIDRRTIFEIHRLHHEGLAERRIARRLLISRQSVRKYLADPSPLRKPICRGSKLDPFQDQIAMMLEKDPEVSAAVILQRLAERGFNGRYTIVKDYLRSVRGAFKRKQAFIRFESTPGEQCQIDWAQFGSIAYGNTKRKLSCLAVIESYSRLLYLEFTHCQRQETLHRCLLNAFRFFQGAPREFLSDNMLTAVIERDGPLIRFNEAYLDFLRPFAIVPKATNPGKPHEKGKVEKGAIHYIRHNFFPLRFFRDLHHLQGQAKHWRDHVANLRVHQSTGQRPRDRFRPQAMRPLPQPLPDVRETLSARVHSDFAVHFDGNTYTVPPWAIGKEVTLKADHQTLTIYFKDKPIAVHTRSYHRKERIESAAHRQEVQKYHRNFWRSNEVAAFISLGEVAKAYLEHLVESHQPIKKSLAKLLALHDRYGAGALIEAIQRASLHHAYGAHYIENILYQQMAPRSQHPPVKLKQERLNQIRLEKPSLAEYDAVIIKKDKEP